MHSKDTTVLIDLLWFNVVQYSSLFQYFFQSSYYCPYSTNFLVYLFENIIIIIIIMIMIMIEIQ